MTSENFFEDNNLIADYMGWGDIPYTCIESLPTDLDTLLSVAAKISGSEYSVGLKVKTSFKGVVGWSASIRTVPYVNLGYGKGVTPEEALYRIIVRYLKKEK